MAALTKRAQWGAAGVRAGAPDLLLNDEGTDIVDALANVLHFAAERGHDPARLIDLALGHFAAERADDGAERADDGALTVIRGGKLTIERDPLTA